MLVVLCPVEENVNQRNVVFWWFILPYLFLSLLSCCRPIFRANINSSSTNYHNITYFQFQRENIWWEGGKKKAPLASTPANWKQIKINLFISVFMLNPLHGMCASCDILFVSWREIKWKSCKQTKPFQKCIHSCGGVRIDSEWIYGNRLSLLLLQLFLKHALRFSFIWW